VIIPLLAWPQTKKGKKSMAKTRTEALPMIFVIASLLTETPYCPTSPFLPATLVCNFRSHYFLNFVAATPAAAKVLTLVSNPQE
jgi:hypothetical protein